MLVGRFSCFLTYFLDAYMKKKRLRKKRDGTFSPRKLLDDGHYIRLSPEEKVFILLTWCGFTNAEAYGVIYPLSEASPNSRAVMAGRIACSHSVKTYISLLNDAMEECSLFFKGQRFKIGELAVDEAIDDLKNKIAEREQ